LTRDPRLDLLRGLVFVILFATHIEGLSVLSYFAFERIGVVSSAESFVALAGVVTGMAFHRKILRDGLSACLAPLITRAFELYKVNLYVILLIGLLHYLNFPNIASLTMFHDVITDQTYALYPPAEAGFGRMVGCALQLRCGPHQYQVVGLYAVLFLLSPLVLMAIRWRKVLWLSLASLALYLYNFWLPEASPGTAELRVTGAQFEFAFPLAAWQFLFVHAVIVGAYKNEIEVFLEAPSRRWIIWLCAAASVGFALFSLNHPLDMFPSWSLLHWIDPDTFDAIYGDYFAKYKLGPGRLINEAVLLVTLFALLTRLWKPINAALGWFFIPLGRASLYVFTVHILLVWVAQTPLLHHPESFWENSLVQFGALGLAWHLVKKEFLFRWIPH
jgi:hypothetical protein